MSSSESQELNNIALRCLEIAKARGASAAEAGVSTGKGLSLTVRLGEVESVEYHRDKSVGVTVYLGERRGSASSSDFSTEALSETVDAAINIARHTAPDSFSGLADTELLAKDFPDLDLYHPWDINPDAAADLARQCEEVARSADARIKNSEGASISTGEGVSVYANSLGFLGRSQGARHSLSCSVIAEDEQGMQRDYWYDVARRHEDLASPEEIGRICAERTLRRLGARKISTCSVPVLFENQVASSLLGHFVQAISGGSLYRKASFLQDSLGQTIFPAHVRIYEEPLRRRGLASASFDGDGVTTHNRELIQDGVLQSYLLDVYSARKLGLQSTGNAGGAHNLTLAPGSEDLQALLRRMGRGLFVTELIGFGVNGVTGDYSRGAAGFWVENGEIQYPVEEITIAGNLREMFQGFSAIGSDLLIHGGTGSPSILINKMTIAGS
ncbi:metalloprotease PmbA [Acidithiobacillus sp. IBUN Pt1247-S3]|uniref:metalloprotease PmbA n=1 Tax=Acidithiobacillus sp. IBUN Pt1247-S3 TaxID=3166642 RepID=UPI0034E40791